MTFTYSLKTQIITFCLIFPDANYWQFSHTSFTLLTLQINNWHHRYVIDRKKQEPQLKQQSKSSTKYIWHAQMHNNSV